MTTFIRNSKFRNTQCTIPSYEEWYHDISPSLSRIEGNSIASTLGHFAYISNLNGSSSFVVRSLSSIGKLQDSKQSTFHGHGKQIHDLCFSLWDPTLIGSSSADGTVKFWKIPKQTGENSISAEMELSFSSSPFGVSFHPLANQLVTIRTQQDIFLHDLKQGKQILHLYQCHEKDITSMCWDITGKYLLSASRDKKMKLWDPRTSFDPINVIEIHNGSGKNSVCWCGAKNLFLSIGWNQIQQREFKIWDPRNLSQTLNRVGIDSNNSQLIPFYDEDTNLLFLGSQGDCNVRFYELSETMAYPIGNISLGEVPSIGLTSIPKKECRTSSCEIVRLLNLTCNTVQPVKFHVPRKQAPNAFQADLYPCTKAYKPAIESEDWLNGLNTDPIYEPLIWDIKQESELANTANITENGWNSGHGWDSEEMATNFEKESSSSEKIESDEVDPSCFISEKALKLGAAYSHKLKYIEGKCASQADVYFNLSVEELNSSICANSNFWAVTVRGTGGPVLVQSHEKKGKIPTDASLFDEHRMAVKDMQFHPFRYNLLATGSEDSTIRIWNVNDEKEEKKSLSCLREHNKGIRSIQFHSHCENILFSASMDGTVKIWDVEKENSSSTLQLPENDAVLDISLNFYGDLLATSSKDKILRVLDPRQQKTMCMTCGHSGSQTQFVRWLTKNNSPFLCTIGFSSSRERQICLWDSRNLLDPIETSTIDRDGSILLPFYDESSSVLYLVSKGERNIFTYQLQEENGNIQAMRCSAFTFPGSPLINATLLPKTMCDVKNVEISSLLCLTQKSIEPVSFYLPRSQLIKEYFQDDVYGYIRSCIPSMTADEWISGENRAPNMISLQPEEMTALSEKPKEETKIIPKAITFKQKLKKHQEEKEAQLQEFNRLQALAMQHAKYHPNHSMGKEECDSENDGWDD